MLYKNFDRRRKLLFDIGIPFRGGGGLFSYEQLQQLVSDQTTPRLTGNNSTIDPSNDWVTGLGGITPDFISYPGNMFLNLTTGNQGVKISGIVEAGTTAYLIKIKVKRQSGPGTKLQIGSFVGGTGDAPEYGIKITPDNEYRWFYGYLINFTSGDFWIGTALAENNGTTFLIDELHIDEVDLSDLYNLNLSKQIKYDNTDLFSELSKSDQELLQINTIGDSILANILGTIPVEEDEGSTKRPIRLVTNNVVRQVYDDRKYNVPEYRRLDNTDCVRSNLSGSDDFTEEIDGAFVFISNPTPYDYYYATVEPQAYCEITIPNGVINAMIIYAKNYQFEGVDFDDNVAVTLNGGSISAYGPDRIDMFTPLDSGEFRNGHSIALYTGLPSGANTIRLTKSNNSKVMGIWGGAYWNGNTMKLNNFAVGGQSIDNLSNWTIGLMEPFDLTTWIFQFPNMNNASNAMEAKEQVTNLIDIINSPTFDEKQFCFITTHPFGTNPSSPTTNYYTQYNTPINFKQRCTLDIALCVYMGIKFIDLFRYFEADIISRGGTLEGGEAGLYYTQDGQHLDEEGALQFATYLLNKLPQIPE